MKKQMFLLLALVLALGIVAKMARYAGAQTPSGTVYYVDFDGGNDAAFGTAPESAWKHTPGDPEATGNAGTVDLQPGDTVSFKGGVVYRGNININASGTDGNPIAFRGDDWGESKAIVDGSAPITTVWTRCESQAVCGNNPNWPNVYHTAAPSGATFTEGFFEDDSFIWQAQDPNPDDPFYYDRIEYFRTISIDDPSVSQTRTSITDPRYFVQSDASFWDGAYVAAWRIPNVTVIRKVTGFDPGTHTITHEDLDGDIYTDRDTYYAVLNHLSVLDQPGEYVLDENSDRFYVWPGDSGHPDQHAYTVLQGGTGIYANGRHHLIIEGFDVQKFTFGIRAIGDQASNVTIQDNHIHLLRSNNWYALQVNGTDMLVENNAVTDCQRAVGILGGGKNITVKNNLVKRTSRQGIWFMGVEHGAIVDNRVVDIKGTHSNGISIYLHHQNILVAGNHVWDTNLALTYHGNDDPDFENNLIIYNNLLENSVHSWGKGMRGVIVLNNTFVEGIFMSTEDRDVIFVNNITNGGGGGTRSYNIYTGLSWNQQPRYGWAPEPGELVGWNPVTEQYEPIDPENVFVDPDGDYHLSADSLALNSGTNVTGILPDLAEFPDVDFGVDLEGNPRPWGAGWDMGAYEFVPDVMLHGAPADRAIRLRWTVNATLPLTSTWQLDYKSDTGTLLIPPLSFAHTVRAHTLSGLTNCVWYTVTLRSMVGSNAVLADSVRVMPTDQFAYLPLVLR